MLQVGTEATQFEGADENIIRPGDFRGKKQVLYLYPKDSTLGCTAEACDLRDINLDGKTVIPFTTHEGSGLASCESDVRKAFPKAHVQRGWSIYGHEVRSSKANVEKWLNGLGY